MTALFLDPRLEADSVSVVRAMSPAGTYAVALAALPPVTLAELTASAERLTRVDRKYLVPRRDLAGLVEAIAVESAGQARVLDIDGRRDFGYRSVYLDTDDLDCFHAAGRRRRRRFKVRTRAYLDTGTAYLEVKTPAPRGVTVKARTTLTGDEFAPLDHDGLSFVTEQLDSVGLAGHDPEDLSPRLITAYRRATLLLTPEGYDPGRATIDTELAWSTLGRHGRDLDRPSLAVVETKAGSTPTAVDRLLWRRGHRPVPLSKYAVGMAALHPDLPHLKWHRTLTQHVQASTSRTTQSKDHA